MAQHGEHYWRQTDEYGNPVRQTDEYGNPVRTGGGTMGQRGTTGTGYGGMQHETTGTGHGGMQYGTTGTGTGVGGKHHGELRRSGSSSSSSSEDDGHGGRRKKELKEKIKEKMPGGHKENEPAHGTATGYGYGHEGEHQEKKGIMDKIKEKLPGHN